MAPARLGRGRGGDAHLPPLPHRRAGRLDRPRLRAGGGGPRCRGARAARRRAAPQHRTAAGGRRLRRGAAPRPPRRAGGGGGARAPPPLHRRDILADELAGYGPEVVVLEPLELRDAVVRRLRRSLSDHRRQADPGGSHDG
ncbi:hypothetical protein [Rathayibacter sp. VKM Ac-2630]|uniref:hypothetical protein n=1 Tax=Rathayibacter sp. VKM Ac-2630 TaxID=1938617 RepID=UPI00406CDBDC